MKQLQIGNSSLNASVLGLGAINFGTKVDEKTSFNLLDTYIENGGNLIDTSNNYAVWNGGNGSESEKTIGKWLKNNDIKNNIIIATKLGALPKDNKNTGFSNMQGLSRNVILENVKRSLYNDFEIF